MRFFDRDDRYNWIDDNNVLLGFDSKRACCENFDFLYHSSLDETTGILIKDEILDKYIFDTTQSYCIKTVIESGEGEDTFTVKLIDPSGSLPDVYLTLYNIHNGYYSHGFCWSKKDIIIDEGWI